MMLCRFSSGKYIQYAIIEPLSKEQEDEIEDYNAAHNSLCFKKGDKIIAENKNILLYGEIDFNNENDIKFINRFNLIDERGAWYYTRYDYNTGVVNSNEGRFLQCITFDCVEWFKYCHCLIGRPKRVIVYKTKINKYKYERD